MSARKDSAAISFADDLKVLYINIVIIDAKDAIQNQVDKNMEKSNMPKPLKGFVKKAAPKIASKLATPEQMAYQMGVKLSRKLPEKMKTKGLDVVVEEAYRNGPYLVLQMQVQKVDTMLIAAEKSDGASTASASSASWTSYFLEWFYSLIGAQRKSYLEESYLPAKVQEKLESAMGELMAEKLEKKKLKADSKVLSEEKQARYFYGKLKEVFGPIKPPKGPMAKKADSMPDSDSDDE